MDEKVEVSTNWQLLRGKNISDSLVIKISENINCEDERPSIDDIVSFEQSIHLQQNDNEKEDCEICFKINLDHKPNSLILVTDCQKLEMFIDIHKEYYNTYVGEFLDDFDGMKVYRFDIDINNNISNFLIKFIPRVSEIWIYGMQIGLKVNSNQIEQSTSPVHNICLENVKSILSESNHKLTPKAEQCKSFVESFLLGNAAKQLGNGDKKFDIYTMPNEFENFRAILSNTHKNFPVSSVTPFLNGENSKVRQLTDENFSLKMDELKNYIDKTVLDMENKIILQLKDFENRQNQKLDKIIEMLSQNIL